MKMPWNQMHELSDCAWVQSTSKNHTFSFTTRTRKQTSRGNAPLALIGQPVEGLITIEFRAERFGRSSDATEKTWREIIHYFFLLNESDPWAYAQYHCSTSANLYSSVQWSFYPRVKKLQPLLLNQPGDTAALTPPRVRLTEPSDQKTCRPSLHSFLGILSAP